MKKLFLGVVLALAGAAPLAPARAQDNPMSYAGRVAKKLDVCPHLRLIGFDFQTSYVSDLGFRRTFTYAWRNDGKKAVVAFEVRTLRFNAFDEQLKSDVTTFPGHNSGNYSALKVGESDGDGVREENDTELFTALAYVSKIRFSDGTIWRASPAVVAAQIKAAAPALASASPTGTAKPAPKK